MNACVEHPLEKYFRNGIHYTTCPGCGNGIVAQCILRAIDEIGEDIDRYAFVSGIGCSGWIPSPAFNTDLLHVTHGRSIPVATGLKIALPGQRVILCQGDGDLSAIGGNHFIHACRRNVDLTVICVNNSIYGMTGGQTAPTTPYDTVTATSPYGNIEGNFDLSSLAAAAGATFVARWTTWHARQMAQSIKKAILHPGFAFVEAISQCPIQYGKAIGLRNDASAMMLEYREKSVSVNTAKSLTRDELSEKIIVGELVCMQGEKEFVSELDRLRKEVGGDAQK
jgi:2-oxoglutarate ferredoxin oxidoreductase subunit beta